MLNAPSDVTDQQLKDLHVKIAWPEKKEGKKVSKEK